MTSASAIGVNAIDRAGGCAAANSSSLSWPDWRRGKLGRSPSTPHRGISGWIALQRDSQAAPLLSRRGWSCAPQAGQWPANL